MEDQLSSSSVNRSISEIIQNKRDLQKSLLDYLSSSDDEEENYQNLIQLLKTQEIHKNRNELVEFLHLVVNVANNYNRTPYFYAKLEKIISDFKSEIQQSFTNMTIFNIFKSNKRLLLYLFDEKIIIPTNHISDIFQSGKYKIKNYPTYFYPEIKGFIAKKENSKYENMGYFALMFQMRIAEMKKSDNERQQPKIGDLYDQNPTNFLQNRKIGENTNDNIYQLIRNDDIEPFISHVKLTSYNLKSQITDSAFETKHQILLNMRHFSVQFKFLNIWLLTGPI